MNPLVEKRFTSIDELIQSDKRIFISEASYIILIRDNPNYQKFISARKLLDIVNMDVIDGKNPEIAYPQQCRDIDFWMTFSADRKNVEGKYKINEPFETSFIRLHVGDSSEYIEKFQHLMTTSFEAGLPKAWRFFQENSIADLIDRQKLRMRSEKKNDEIFLDFYQIIPMFFILVIGHSIALLGFLGEILWSFCKRKFKKIRKRHEVE